MDFSKILELHEWLDAQGIAHIALNEFRLPMKEGFNLTKGNFPHQEFWKPIWDNKKVWGIGLVTGKQNGVLALDFDIEDINFISELTPLIKDFKHIRLGNPKRLGVVFCKYDEAFAKKGKIILSPNNIIEVLSNGQYVAIPPSWHNKYQKVYGHSGRSFKEEIMDLISMPETLNSYLVSRLPAPSNKIYTGDAPNAWEAGRTAFERFVNQNIPCELIMPFNSHYLNKGNRFITLNSSTGSPGANIKDNGYFITSHNDEIATKENKSSFTPHELIRCYINSNVAEFIEKEFPSEWEQWLKEEKEQHSPEADFSEGGTVEDEDLEDNDDFLTDEEKDGKNFYREILKTGNQFDVYNRLIPENIQEFILDLDKNYLKTNAPMDVFTMCISVIGSLAAHGLKYHNLTPNQFFIMHGPSGGGKSSLTSILSLGGHTHFSVSPATFNSKEGFYSAVAKNPSLLIFTDEVTKYFSPENKKSGHLSNMQEAFLEAECKSENSPMFLALSAKNHGLSWGARISFLGITTTPNVKEIRSAKVLRDGFERRTSFYKMTGDIDYSTAHLQGNSSFTTPKLDHFRFMFLWAQSKIQLDYSIADKFILKNIRVDKNGNEISSFYSTVPKATKEQMVFCPEWDAIFQSLGTKINNFLQIYGEDPFLNAKVRDLSKKAQAFAMTFCFWETLFKIDSPPPNTDFLEDLNLEFKVREDHFALGILYAMHLLGKEFRDYKSTKLSKEDLDAVKDSGIEAAYRKDCIKHRDKDFFTWKDARAMRNFFNKRKELSWENELEKKEIEVKINLKRKGKLIKNKFHLK